MTQSRAIVAAARRTPIGRVGGALSALSIEEITAPLLRSLLEDIPVNPEEVCKVILGNAAGGGGNPARLSSLAAGFPVDVAAMTIDCQCGSGLEAINIAARMIEAGSGDVFIAGGVESVSTAPWRVEKPQTIYQLPRFTNRARFAPDVLGDPNMGVAAETIARVFEISRERQDCYALRSHQKAVNSMLTGRFKDELLPLTLPGNIVVDMDECPRADTSLEKLEKLSPVFVEGGTITAGNACPINDGAAAALILSEEKFRAMGLTKGLRIVDAASVGVDPNMPGMGPVAAVNALLNKYSSKISIDEIDLVEFNEAFAVQALACLDALKVSEAKVNIGGGALALGHPYGASGAILVTRLFAEMARAKTSPSSAPSLGLATLGVAGGLGIATLFERYEYE